MSWITFTEESTIPQPPEIDGKKSVRISAIDDAGTLRPKAKDSDGNDIDFLGPQGIQGPPGPGTPITEVVNIHSPTELQALTIIGEQFRIVRQEAGGTDEYESTQYLAIASRPFAQDIPYVVNDSSAGQYIASGGRYDKGAKSIKNEVIRGGRAVFSKATAQAMINNGADEIAILDTIQEADSSIYSLAANIVTIEKSGRFRVNIGGDFVATASTAARVCTMQLEKSVAFGAFTKVPETIMYMSDVNTNRPNSAGKQFSILLNATDRVRLVANVSTQASATELRFATLLFEKVQ